MLTGLSQCSVPLLKGYQVSTTHMKLVKMIGLERLETRRIHADLIMCYEIIHQLVNTPLDQFYKAARCSSTRGHPLKL